MKIVKILAILSGVVLAIFLLAELVLHLMMPVDLEPRLRLELSNEIPGMVEKNVIYEISGNGLRGYQWSKKPASDALRVLVVGSNSTNHMIQNVTETWWGQLAQMLEKESGKRVEAAAIGNLPNSQIMTGAAAAAKLLEEESDIDVMLVQYGLGDILEPASNYKFDEGKLAKLSQPANEGMKVKLAKISQIARRIRAGRIRDSRRARQTQLAQPNYYAAWLNASFNAYRERPFATKLERPEDPEKEFLAGVKAFIDLAKAKGIKVMFIGEPTLHHEFITFPESGRLSSLARTGPGVDDLSRVNPEWLQTELDRYYFDAGSYCLKEGVPFVSLNGRVPRTLEYFLSDSLYTDAGAKKAAELLLPEVKKLVP